MQTEAKRIGAAIRDERLARDLTQEDLAQLVRVRHSTVQNWESGRSEGPRHSELIRLCALFDWLLPWDVDDDSGDSSTARYVSSADWPMLGSPARGSPDLRPALANA
jgi:transcriptional regulator with XRE-family HTH domain